ncbi:hypothetical protein [Gymnodinialimonas hymeniacidonis]|uniref:hypothetical protein n=1 Tax=Gymnodinialimonas hymeniacidonis TaxID=3126508 RepID=UPI0034C69945
MRLLATTALLCTPPLAAPAQEAPVEWTCLLNVMCPHTGACRDLAQTIAIIEGNEGWTVDWIDTDLPSDYELIADLPPVEGAAHQTRVRSLMHRDPDSQTVQTLTFDSTGHVIVTTHQPHAGMQVVTGLGTCEQS